KRRLCGRWRAETIAISRAFGVDIDSDPPEFCASIPCEKAVLAGNLVGVVIEQLPDGALISLFCGFRDDAGNARIDYSFPVTRDGLESIRGLPLNAAIPGPYMPSFGLMWNELSAAVRKELCASWSHEVQHFRFEDD